MVSSVLDPKTQPDSEIVKRGPKYPGPFFHIETAQTKRTRPKWELYRTRRGVYSAVTIEEAKLFAENNLMIDGKVAPIHSPLQTIRIIDSSFEALTYYGPPSHEWTPIDPKETDTLQAPTMPLFSIFEIVGLKLWGHTERLRIEGVLFGQDGFSYKLSNGLWYTEDILESTLTKRAAPLFQMGQEVRANGVKGTVDGIELVRYNNLNDYAYKVNGVWIMENLIIAV